MQTKPLHGLSTSSCASGHPCTSQRWRDSWDWPQRRTLPLVALYQQGSLSFTLPGMLGAPLVVFRTPIPSWGEIAYRNCLPLVKKTPTKIKQTSSIGWRDARTLLLCCLFLVPQSSSLSFFHHSEFTCSCLLHYFQSSQL